MQYVRYVNRRGNAMTGRPCGDDSFQKNWKESLAGVLGP